MRPAHTLTPLLLLLAAAGPAFAEPPKVKVTAARVGLPPADRDAAEQAGHVCKFATWAPVFVELEVAAAVTEPAELVVEAPDADRITTVLAVPLNLAGVAPGRTLTTRNLALQPYVRTPAGGDDITVTVRTSAGVPLSDPFRIRAVRPKDTLTYVVLGLGSKLPGFELPKPSTGADESLAADALRGGRIALASITDVDDLPDQWFGYDAADLVVLTTADGDFARRLFGPNPTPADEAKRAALQEWVRRGGRLVISLGANAAAALPRLGELLPYALKPGAPTRGMAQLALYWNARETSQASVMVGNLVAKGAPFPLANLTPRADRAARLLIPPPSRQADDPEPVAVQAGFGLGRVTLIGFDLDRPPFTDFTLRAEFWDWILREGGASKASVGNEGKTGTVGAGPSDEEDELALALRTHADTFDGVPVVSFGWVAFLIALYALLIGPVEYYFLRKILGRPELTWLTFPLIVLTVCVAAYLTAVAAKGRELRVNKLDVVEVDPASGRVYGTTLFTVFSPRIDNYTIGVTPAEGWTENQYEPGGTLLGWVGSPQAGRTALVRRKYSYHTDPAAHVVADGLDDVPIQVWSTKSFVANWAGKIASQSPVVESRLEHPPGDPTKVIGTFVNRMPFPAITDCVVFYAGQAFPLQPGGTILTGQTVRLVFDKGVPAVQWLQNEGQLANVLARAQAFTDRPLPVGPAAGASPTGLVPDSRLPLLGVLFHEAALRNDEGVIPRNASLRRLDQSWRLNPGNRDEVILVGRVVPPAGPAETLLGGPESPSRLWLKGLPGAGPRWPITGTARQETYVRLYLPVKPAGVAR